MNDIDSSIRVIIADDHLMFLDGLKEMLSKMENIEVVGTALNGQQVLDLMKDQSVNLLITDISMPDVDGIALSNMVKKKYSDTKVLVLSMHSRSDIIAKLVQYNIDGYLLKNAGKSELILAIESIMRGEKYFTEEVKQKYMESMFSPPNKKKSEVKLSKRETEILILIAKEDTVSEIADKLFISKNTVETHRKNIFRKLEIKNKAGAVKYAIQHDLIN